MRKYTGKIESYTRPVEAEAIEQAKTDEDESKQHREASEQIGLLSRLDKNDN